MIKFLKNKQNLQSILVLIIVFATIFWSGYLLIDDRERIEELESQLEVLDESSETAMQSLDELKQRQTELVETLRGVNQLLETKSELLETRLEQNKELFLEFEQRIAKWQEVLNNPDLDRTDISFLEAEMADVMQTLKLINETDPTDLTESTFLNSNSTETD